MSARRTRRSRLFLVLGRGLRRRCPQCGEGRLYAGWYGVVERCAVCGLALGRLEGDCWAFMYLSTGFFTGVLIVVMLLVHPPSLLLGQVAVGAAALALMGLTLPTRKGVALAFTYWIELTQDEGHGHALRDPGHGPAGP